ncbi:hypothetical protein [Rhodanobacter sp. DHG33]|uniref:hypothetical protein n=1 Tax=Rhodanobacter sp. DHG33 TaxID=2775921 RepID=UPI00177EC0FE|nr:hypothetical protein [Rhodanobacter sp. DHG33]MBD8897570.1 hypothetical protein [Rhodanobacter sp. DHG33]
MTWLGDRKARLTARHVPYRLREKDAIGKVWAASSDKRCVFLMATDAKTAGKPVSLQLRDAIES